MLLLLSDHSEITFSFRVIEITWLDFFVLVGGEVVLMAYIVHSIHYIFASLSWNGSVTVLITT